MTLLAITPHRSDNETLSHSSITIKALVTCSETPARAVDRVPPRPLRRRENAGAEIAVREGDTIVHSMALGRIHKITSDDLGASCCDRRGLKPFQEDASHTEGAYTDADFLARVVVYRVSRKPVLASYDGHVIVPGEELRM